MKKTESKKEKTVKYVYDHIVKGSAVCEMDCVL